VDIVAKELQMKSEVKTFKSAEDLYESAAKFVLKAALQAVEESGRFSIALSGGRTPVALYEKLTTRPIKEDMPWKKTNFFLGDERCVPPDHEESNFKMIEETLLSKISIPEGNIHRILAEIKPPEKAALLYEEDVRSFFGVDENNKAPSFDLIVLGLGIDGHTHPKVWVQNGE
jgi:6-phosphogluconolactonase